MQGMAVRMNQHLPVYHWSFRIYHLAPALAILLLRNKQFEEVIDSIAEDIDIVWRKGNRLIQKGFDW